MSMVAMPLLVARLTDPWTDGRAAESIWGMGRGRGMPGLLPPVAILDWVGWGGVLCFFGLLGWGGEGERSRAEVS